MIQNMVIITFICFWTFSLLVVFLQLLKVDGQKYNVTNWSMCIETKDSFVNLVGVSIAECVDACIRRQTCRSIGYRRRMQFCEIHKEDNLVTNANGDSCIFIERNDMDTTNADICSCSHVGHVCNLMSGVCEIKECGHPELLNGTIYGNCHYIGAKLLISCAQGFIKQVTCSSTGEWDPTPVCEEPTTASGNVTTNVTAAAANITIKEYYCPVASYAPNYTRFDLHGDGVRIDTRTNITFQTKGAHDAHILLQNDRNVTSSNVIEIVLGAGGNTWSVMRNAPTSGSTLASNIAVILDPNAYQYFWISWGGGCVQVGKGSVVGTSGIMNWCALSFTISGMRIGYGWGSDGYFKFEL